MPHGGAGSTEDTFEFKACHNIGITFVMIEFLQTRRIVGLTAGAKNHRTDFNIFFQFNLTMNDGFRQTRKILLLR